VFGKEQLFGHGDAVSALAVCKPFSIMVSASADTTCIIWDLNK
jgi:WD40 repeat protein